MTVGRTPENQHGLDRLPGGDLVRAGLDDLKANRDTVAAALVRTASRRLRELGYSIEADTGVDGPVRLYRLVEAEVGAQQAHARYNALRRRLVSFLQTAGHARSG